MYTLRISSLIFIYIYMACRVIQKRHFLRETQRWVRVLVSRGGSFPSCPTALGLACAAWRSRTSTGRLLARSATAVQRQWPRWSSKGAPLRRRSAPAAQGTLSSLPKVRIFIILGSKGERKYFSILVLKVLAWNLSSSVFWWIPCRWMRALEPILTQSTRG